jgi:hypothetical protein
MSDPLVVRTDFTDQAAWLAITAEVQAPQGEDGFLANVKLVDERSNDTLPLERLRERIASRSPCSFAFVVDTTTISHPEHPLLVIGLRADGGADFRAIPSAIQSIENNLSLGNMDFDEFASSADEDGIFRDFPA